MHDMISNKTLRWEYSRHHEDLDRPGQDIYIYMSKGVPTESTTTIMYLHNSS